MDPVTAKFILSLIGLVIAGALVWFGYRMFVRGIVSHSSGGLSATGFSLNWRSAGPGVAFMLLGAAIALAAILRPMSRTENITTPFGSHYGSSTAAGDVVISDTPPEGSAEAPTAESAVER